MFADENQLVLLAKTDDRGILMGNQLILRYYSRTAEPLEGYLELKPSAFPIGNLEENVKN